MLRGPANRPAVLGPAVIFVVVGVAFVLRNGWVAAGVAGACVVVVLAAGAVWARFGPRRRAGRVRRG
jgi:hypothetical protein